MHSDEFLLLGKEALIGIISSDEINVKNEEQVYNSVMNWVKFDLNNRRMFLSEVLGSVRFCLMSPKFLVSVSSDVLVKNDEACRDLVDEAKNYLLLPNERAHMQGPRTRPRKPIRRGEVLFAGQSQHSVDDGIENYCSFEARVVVNLIDSALIDKKQMTAKSSKSLKILSFVG